MKAAVVATGVGKLMTTPEKRLDRVRAVLDKFLEDYPQLYKAHYQKRCGQSGVTLIHINSGYVLDYYRRLIKLGLTVKQKRT